MTFSTFKNGALFFFCIPTKTAEISWEVPFFPAFCRGLPHREAARHISGPGFGDGWTDKEAINHRNFGQNKLEIVLKNEFNTVSDFSTRFVIGFMASFCMTVLGFLPSHLAIQARPRRSFCRRSDSD